MLNPETPSVIQKLGSGESSQVDVGWLLDHQVKTTLGLALQETFYFLHNLKAIFNWHLEVENEQIDWFEDFPRYSCFCKPIFKCLLHLIDCLLPVECVLD